MAGGTRSLQALRDFFRDNPEVVGDMWALYGVDVTGPFRVALVLRLLERLAYEPFSLWRAKRLSDDARWFGWGLVNQQLADLVDRASITAKTAGKGATLKDSERSPRPGDEDQKRVVSTRDWKTVAALYGGA